jgi:hypothetical protein
MGHVDRMSVEAPTDGGDAFEGFTLRLFDPRTATWRIWWSSTRVPCVLDIPVQGQFVAGRGVFEVEDTIGGHDVVVRFEWLTDRPDLPRPALLAAVLLLRRRKDVDSQLDDAF